MLYFVVRYGPVHPVCSRVWNPARQPPHVPVCHWQDQQFARLLSHAPRKQKLLDDLFENVVHYWRSLVDFFH